MRRHEHYEMLISRYKDKDLNAEEILEMEEHLSSCESCRKFKSDIDSISLILSGGKSITIDNNKIKNRFYPYIISIAAILLIFVVSIIILNNNINIRDRFIASNEPIIQDIGGELANTQGATDFIFQDIDGDGYADYAPLSAYFNDYVEEEYSNNDEVTVLLSSYMSYVGID